MEDQSPGEISALKYWLGGIGIFLVWYAVTWLAINVFGVFT
jgi:hypothetical protein